MKTKSVRIVLVLAATAAILLFVPAISVAQLNGQNIKGDAGLKSGSQAPPGAYVVIPLWFYTADAVKNRDGSELLSGNLDAAVFGAALNVVTTRKLLGANYGFLAVLPWANNRVQGATWAGISRGPTSPPHTDCFSRPGAMKMARATAPV